jgi:hypothetical protein
MESRPFFVEATEGQTLQADPRGVMQLSGGAGSGALQWVPVSTGDPDNPGLVFYRGRVLLYPIPGP